MELLLHHSLYSKFSMCLKTTFPFQVLIETLTELGAKVRWANNNIYSTQVSS